MKSSDSRVKQGDTIPMKYAESSCGSDIYTDKKGMIIAKIGTDSKGDLTLHPYSYHHDYIHGSYSLRIVLPFVLPEAGYLFNPSPLQIGENVRDNFAVVLIGVVGTESLDYVSFEDASARWTGGMRTKFLVPPKGIVAIRIPIGIKQLSISSAITGLARAGGHPNEMNYADTPRFDIDRPGLYYVATLDTDHLGQFHTTPSPEQLKQFRAEYAATIQNLKPINFQWPSQ